MPHRTDDYLESETVNQAVVSWRYVVRTAIGNKAAHKASSTYITLTRRIILVKTTASHRLHHRTTRPRAYRPRSTVVENEFGLRLEIFR